MILEAPIRLSALLDSSMEIPTEKIKLKCHGLGMIRMMALQ